MRSKMIKTAILAAALAVPGVAHAANAIVTTDLNIRTGPGVNYRDVGTIPSGYPITVNNCLSARSWCDVTWNGRRGWVSSNYVAIGEPAPRRRVIRQRRVQPSVSLSFSLGDRHHDRRHWDRRHDRRHWDRHDRDRRHDRDWRRRHH